MSACVCVNGYSEGLFAKLKLHFVIVIKMGPQNPSFVGRESIHIFFYFVCQKGEQCLIVLFSFSFFFFLVEVSFLHFHHNPTHHFTIAQKAHSTTTPHHHENREIVANRV